ncbi:outer membrane protein assembly factor BamE domain-containing protein [Mariniblastus fucicola]|uniref:Outer membrane protein assembly factor BamE domain-containing protein n=1 Tax=Mariniblastus fucicola TaxID=980251 RepID=A0A5B9PBD3_9BACT|nr:outer membrane protein assembly factor BamE [Mariniblastus fucicola]QEG22242.1 hypothetical protein MFFC18_21180 [Mariniblastus fucicola]
MLQKTASQNSDLKPFLKFCATVAFALMLAGSIPIVASYYFGASADNVMAIDPGMTKAQVEKLLGTPDQIDGANWLYSVRGHSDLVQIQFTNGRVIQISF